MIVYFILQIKEINTDIFDDSYLNELNIKEMKKTSK